MLILGRKLSAILRRCRQSVEADRGLINDAMNDCTCYQLLLDDERQKGLGAWQTTTSFQMGGSDHLTLGRKARKELHYSKRNGYE